MAPQTNSDTLYIRIGTGEFIFAQYDRLRSQTLNFVSFKVNPDISINANMHQALQEVPLVEGDYNFVRVLVEGSATLVPLNEFEEDDCEELYFFNLPEKQKRRRVFYDTLPHMNAVLLFSIDKDICHTLEETFKNLFFQSAETPLLLHLASTCPPSPGNGRLFACLQQETMSLVGFRNGKIGLYNTFKLHNVEDAAYYTLQATHLWNFQPSVDEVIVVGNRQMADKLQEELKPYAPHCSVLKAEEEFNNNVLALQRALPYDMILYLLRAY